MYEEIALLKAAVVDVYRNDMALGKNTKLNVIRELQQEGWDAKEGSDVRLQLDSI